MKNEVSEILFKYWDVVGVNQNPECSDEYDSYVEDIVALLECEDCTFNKVLQHLTEVRELFFGLPDKNGQDVLAAEKLFILRQQEKPLPEKLIDLLQEEKQKQQVCEKLGYQPFNDNALARLNGVLSDKFLGLTLSFFDNKYSSVEYVNALCDALSIENYKQQLTQLQALAYYSQFGFAPKIFIDTNFKRSQQPVFALAAMESRRNISFDRLQALEPLDEQIPTVQQWVVEHFKAHHGKLDLWGEIQRYVYFYAEGKKLILSTDGQLLDDVEVNINHAHITV